MSCEELLAAAAAHKASCRPTGEDGWLLTLASPYSDGGLPRILVKHTEGRWVADDLGEAVGRLFDVGIDVTPAISKTLERISEANRVAVVGHALVGEAGETELPGLLARMSAALVQADALPILAPDQSTTPFRETVRGWVSHDLGFDLTPRYTARVGDRTFNLTAMVHRSRQERDSKTGTLVQAVDDQRGVEHAFYAFTALKSRYPAEQLLAVLSKKAFARSGDVAHLASAGYVTEIQANDVSRNWISVPDTERREFSRVLPAPELPTGAA